MISRTTVVIPTYNDSRADITAAIRSVLRQSLKPAEVIVVDDGSLTDCAERVVSELSLSTQVKISYVKQVNSGPSSARNTGLTMATTEYVAFLDSDDQMLADNIRDKQLALDSLPSDYVGVYGLYLRGKKGRVNKNVMEYDGVPDPDHVGKPGCIPGGVPSYLLRIQAVEAVGGFDESLVNNEDIDLLIRMVRRGGKFKGVVGVGFIRNYREGSVSRNRNYQLVRENLERFLEKAAKNTYFSHRELLLRRFGVEMEIAKMYYSGGDLKSCIDQFERAFRVHPPVGIKQQALNAVVRSRALVLRCIGRVNQDFLDRR